MIDSADDGIFADISSAGEQEIEQRCLQDVGKYSNSFNCYCYTLILVCCTGVNTDLGMQDLSKIQKQLASLEDKSQLHVDIIQTMTTRHAFTQDCPTGLHF